MKDTTMQSKNNFCENLAQTAQFQNTQVSQEANMNKNGSKRAKNELRAMLQKQLEFYFSRENLAHDSYLLSQMDSDQYVPITTIANFEKVKSLTKDVDLIVEVLRESSNVQVDEAGEKVRPNHKRCVLILREIPGDTPINEVENLFNGKNCPKFVSCEFAHNSSWYVTFETDEDAQRAYRYIREEIKTFRVTGKPIMARIKAKPIMHSSNYKNGTRQPSTTVTPTNATVPQNSTDMFNSQSQPHTPTQAQRRYQVPNSSVRVNLTSQVYPPFYPPTMLQAWTPTTSACYDLSAVFIANGLSPHMFGSSIRRSYHGIKPNGGRTKPFISKRAPFVYNGNNNNQTILKPSPVVLTNTVFDNYNGGSNATKASNDRLRASDKSENANKPLTVNAAPTVNHDGALNGTGSISPASSASSTSTKRYSNLNNLTEKPLGTNETENKRCTQDGGISKGRIHSEMRVVRKKKDENLHDSHCDNDLSIRNSYAKHVEQIPFDFEASAFPPLPLHEQENNDFESPVELKIDLTASNCSSLADVVKGTVKLRDICKMQNEFGDCLVDTDKNATFVINNLDSEAKDDTNENMESSCVDDQLNDNFDETSAKSSQKSEEFANPTKSPSPTLSSKTMALEVNDILTKDKTGTKCEENEKRRTSECSDISDSSNKINNNSNTSSFQELNIPVCNGHTDASSENGSIEDDASIKSQSSAPNQMESKRLTYSQIAQRAQNKVSQGNDVPVSTKETRDTGVSHLTTPSLNFTKLQPTRCRLSKHLN